MENRWSKREAESLVLHYADDFSRDFALRCYSGRLLGQERSLVLHGGGNISLKGEYCGLEDKLRSALFIKPSGFDLSFIQPDDFVAVDIERLRTLASLDQVSDWAMLNELMLSRFDHQALVPSIETLVHAVLPARFVDHTHADAVLTLTNQVGGEDHVRRALGDDVIILPYVKPGFPLGRQVAQAVASNTNATAMVWMHHGITVWGDTPKSSYDRMIELVSVAEDYLNRYEN